jgi:import inner membrane translocase subunit TIM8
MGWFGGSESPKPTSKDYSSTDESFSSSMGDSPSGYSANGPATSYSNDMAAGATSMEQYAEALQQKAIIQEVVSKLTAISFEACVGKPDSQLSSREISCIHASVGKYLDGSDFILGRMQRKQG